jgi:hypothetical protein
MKQIKMAGIALMACMAFASEVSWAQSTLQYDVVTDQYGHIVGNVVGNVLTVDTSLVTSGTATIPATLRDATTNVSTVVQAPISGFAVICAGGAYNGVYGVCTGGTAPLKVVQITSYNNPAAQMSPPACGTGTVPTFLTGSGWSCRPPPAVQNTGTRRM